MAHLGKAVPIQRCNIARRVAVFKQRRLHRLEVSLDHGSVKVVYPRPSKHNQQR
jgi:hypothetical protein